VNVTAHLEETVLIPPRKYTQTDEQNSIFQESPTSSEEQGFCLHWIIPFHDCVLSYTTQLSANLML